LIFSDQVEALTGVTISASGTNPTNDQLSQYLVDGTKDVINKMIVARPEEISKFTTTTASGSGTSVVKTGKILSVVREHNSVTILRQCSIMNPSDRYNAADSDSLSYRSETNPGYYELNGSIHTVPAAAQADDNEVHVTQVSYAVNQGHSSSSIDNFPDEYEYLVVLYASIKTLETAAASKTVAQDIELQASYSQLANTLKGEYMAALQTQQPQQGAQPRR
jgi:hypothetical protein